MDDFPWQYFVHRGAAPAHDCTLSLVERGTTGEAANIFVQCSCPNVADRSMAEAMGKRGEQELPACRGTTHLGTFGTCDKNVRTIALGATNSGVVLGIWPTGADCAAHGAAVGGDRTQSARSCSPGPWRHSCCPCVCAPAANAGWPRSGGAARRAGGAGTAHQDQAYLQSTVNAGLAAALGGIALLIDTREAYLAALRRRTRSRRLGRRPRRFRLPWPMSAAVSTPARHHTAVDGRLTDRPQAVRRQPPTPEANLA